MKRRPSPPAGGRDRKTEPSGRRGPGITVLVSACSLAVITYLQRVGFATASAQFKTSLGLTDDHLGWIMAAFMIGYGVFEMPWGFLGDRFGVRHTVAIIVIGGSIAHRLARLVAFLPPQVVLIVGFLLLAPISLRCFQAGTFPSISRMMADWMPSSERGFAQGAIWMSSRIGGARTARLGLDCSPSWAGGSCRWSICRVPVCLVRPVLALVSQPARRDGRGQLRRTDA